MPVLQCKFGRRMEIHGVHMISLAAELDRRQLATELLASLPWHTTLHDAQDARTHVGLEATTAQFKMGDGTDEDVPAGYRPKWRGPLAPGEIGCLASHISVWKVIAESGADEMHVVLEDDVTVPDVPGLVGFFSDLGSDWSPLPELIYLGYERFEPESKPWYWPAVGAAGHVAMRLAGQIKPSLRSDIRNHLLARRYPRTATQAVVEPNRTIARQHALQEAGLHDGTWAYAISTRGAHKLAQLAEPMCLRSDELINVAVAMGVITAFTPARKYAIPRSDLASTLFSERDFRSYTP